MNLRTITCWAIYNPKRKEIVTLRQFKHQIVRVGRDPSWPIVKLKGHYLPARSQSEAVKK